MERSLHAFPTGKKRDARMLVIVLGSMTLAFVIGIKTAGEVQPVVSSLRASDYVLAGDLNGNGVIDIADAKAAVEVLRQVRTPNPTELSADPDKDYVITMKDVEFILNALEKVSQM